MLTIAFSESQLIVAPSQQLAVLPTDVDVVTSSGSTQQSTIKDANFLITETATVRRDLQINASATPPMEVSFESLSPAVATVNQQGYVQTVSSGTVGVLIKAGSVRKRVDHTAGTDGGQIAEIFQSYTAGTFGQLANTEMDGYAVAGGDLQVFSLKDNTTPAYTRNSNCWINADLTCWPVWNSQHGNRFSGCLISPRHIVLAKHCGVVNGTTMRFVSQNNTIVERTVSNRIDVGTYDLQIAALNSDVPESISFAKVFPADWSDVFTFADIPLIGGNRLTEIVVRSAASFFSNVNSRGVIHSVSNNSLRLAYTKNFVSGDSGSPVFCLVDNQPVLIGTHFFAGGCPFVSAYISEVNAAMTTLGGGYQLTTVDLSDYPNF